VADYVVQRAREIWATLPFPAAAPGNSAAGDGTVTDAEAGAVR
jgi:hypothetical protein